MVSHGALSSDVAIIVTAPPSFESVGGLQKLPLGGADRRIQSSPGCSSDIGSPYAAKLTSLTFLAMIAAGVSRIVIGSGRRKFKKRDKMRQLTKNNEIILDRLRTQRRSHSLLPCMNRCY
jgi:hypothetical protein